MSTTPARMYSKHDVRNSAVFSEFSMLDFSGLTTGGMYQGCWRTATNASA